MAPEFAEGQPARVPTLERSAGTRTAGPAEQTENRLLQHNRLQAALGRRNRTSPNAAIWLSQRRLRTTSPPLAAIEAVTRIDANTPLPEAAQRLGVLGAIEPANLMLRLDRPFAVRITHGLGRKSRDLVLHLDEPQVLIDAVARARRQVDTTG